MFRDLKTGLKIQLSFALAVLLLTAVGGVGWRVAAHTRASLVEVADARVPAVNALTRLGEIQTTVQRALFGAVIKRSDAAMRAEAYADLKESWTGMDEAARAFEALPLEPAQEAAWKASRASWAAWRSSAEATQAVALERARLIEGGVAGDDPAVKAVDDRAWAQFQESRRLAKVSEAELEKVRAITSEDAAAAARDGKEAADTGVAWAGALVLLGAVVVTALGFVLARGIRRSLGALSAEARKLRDAVAAGKLGVRGDEATVAPEFRPIVAGINETLDAYTRPIGVTVDYVTRISNGDIPPPITERYEGDFNRIKDALNRCIGAVNALVSDAGGLVTAAKDGKLATRADASRHQGDFRRIVQGVNDTLDAVVGPLTVAAKTVDEISKGAIPSKISAEWKGDFDLLKRNLNTCVDSVNALVADAGMLVDAAVAGKLSTRADASRHQGDFRKIVQGVNDAIGAIVTPFKVVADYCERISHGDLPPRRTNEVHGDIVGMQASLNRCVDAVTALVSDVDGLAAAAVDGKLSTRAEASRHEGAFRKAVDGVNRTLDAVAAPMVDSIKVLEQLSQRDLRARVSGSYQGDLARMKEAVNATGEALHDALAQVAAAVEQVSSASTQIAASSQAVASGASEQASSLAETTTSIESLSERTKHSADSAHQANLLAQSARSAAGEGATAVEQMQGAMGRIKTSAEGTSQIIRDINDIAFQTNLLALNAAVEAARAGEAGRGFAVVAEEVRSLALRAKEAASKTEELIRQSVKEAGEGEVTAKQVAGKLAEIGGGVSKVSDIVAEIAAAANEQSRGIEQVNKAVTEMDKVTQQNAASAEESSSAASELSGQAEELAAMVAGFQLDRRQAAPAAAPAKKLGAARRPALPPAQANGHVKQHGKHDDTFPMGDF